ncbi:MAG: hydroxyacid dehydrogenase [Bacteriovoracaceae bacterium]|nr:hydroxyacid dehydrogenase [Bacteriovoracaceae bacterium]
MKPFIVVADGFDKNLFKILCAEPTLEVFPESKVSPEKLKELLPRVQGLVVRSATLVNEELLSSAPNLRYVVRAGEGTDNIDKKLCAEKKVKVVNTPGANNNSAAEHAIALMFTLLRKTAWAHSSMQKGEWNKNDFEGSELTGKKIGIVGFGRIGQIVAKRLAGFDPQILFYDPFIEKSEFTYAKKASGLEEIFSSCDIITIHVPLMAQTTGLVSAKLLNSMLPHAVLINASRGKIVDEVALLEILSQNKIKGAAFDVFEKEPLPSDSPLRALKNIVLTPHLGASTAEAQLRVGEMAIHQLKEFFIHNKLLNEAK